MKFGLVKRESTVIIISISKKILIEAKKRVRVTIRLSLKQRLVRKVG